MAKDRLYKIVSNENVATVREAGLIPRPTTWATHSGRKPAVIIEQPRVWLLTNINAAYRVAHAQLIRRKDFHVHHISLPDEERFPWPTSFDFVPGRTWRKVGWNSKTYEWRLFKPDVYSIITIDRSAVKFFPSEVPHMLRELRRAVVWTPDVVPPSAFVGDIRPLDRGYFQSPAFKRFMGEPPATARERKEAQLKRHRWLIDVVEARDGRTRFKKVRNPAYTGYITNRVRSKN